MLTEKHGRMAEGRFYSEENYESFMEHVKGVGVPGGGEGRHEVYLKNTGETTT